MNYPAPGRSSNNPFGDDEEASNPFDDTAGDSGDEKNPFNEEPDDDASTNPFNETTEKLGGPVRSAGAAQSPRAGLAGVAPVAAAAPRKYPAPLPPAQRVQAQQLARERSGAIVKSLIPLEETTHQHHELFLQEIEAVDEYWGPTFRGVYESGEHQLFLERLEERIRRHDRDIEKMCSHHYQGFIDSVRDLLRVRSEAVALRQEVETIDKEVRESCARVISSSSALVTARTVEANIATTIESLTDCLPTLQMVSKLWRQLRDKAYHPALKTLEQLETQHLPKVSEYRFSKQMVEQVPKLRESIKESSMTDLKDFLENIRKYSPKMGEIAMRHAAEQLELDLSGAMPSDTQPRPQPNPFTGDVPYESASESTYDTEEDLAAPDLVDFSPVYRCLHIYTVLGERDVYERYYRKQRGQQCTLSLSPPPNMAEEVEGYRTFFHGIVGFFVCEDHILNTGGGLVSRGYLEEVWAGASSKIVSTLRTHSSYCTDAGFMLKIKNLIMLFASTLKTYGYPVDCLYSLLQELRDHYNEVLMQRWVLKFRGIVEQDNYHPISVTTPAEYADVTASFPYSNQALEEADFPKQFPFSAMVPRVYTEVQDFILSCLQFSSDLGLSAASLDTTVRGSTNLLLTRTLAGCLSALIRRSSLSLLQLIQIVINSVHLEQTNLALEEFISELTGAQQDQVQGARLQARSMFKDTQAEGEDYIVKKLTSKMNEFIELANYDWMLSEPTGHASPWLMDLIAFLKSIFESFTNLPTRLAQVSCMRACQHTARAMIELLLDENTKAMSLGVLQQMDLDLVQCEMFASSEPVPGLEDGVLLLSFSDLRQLLDLFVAWDWATYFADFGKTEASRYQRVQPGTALALLEKLKEGDKKSSSFGGINLNKKDRDKVKLRDVVHKQLKSLVQATTTS